MVGWSVEREEVTCGGLECGEGGGDVWRGRR